MRRAGQPLGLGHKVAPLAFVCALIGLGGCGHMTLPEHVHFVVKVQVRYGQSMRKPALSIDYLDFGIDPSEHNERWLSQLEAFLQPRPFGLPQGEL